MVTFPKMPDGSYDQTVYVDEDGSTLRINNNRVKSVNVDTLTTILDRG